MKPAPRRPRFRLPLHIHISTLFFLLVLGAGSAIGWVSYQRSVAMLERAAEDLVRRVAEQTLAETDKLLQPVGTAVRLTALERLTGARTLAERRASLPFLRRALMAAGAASSIYAGYANGDFFLLFRIRDEEARRATGAPPGADWLVQSIEGGRARFLFLDDGLAVLRDEPRPEFVAGFDPRARGWYRDAQASDGLVYTEPYLFATTGKAGVTVARRAEHGGAVIGADIRLASLDASLARQRITPGSRLVVLDARRRVVAASDPGEVAPALAGDAPALRSAADFGGVIGALARQPVAPSGQVALAAFQAEGRDWHGAVMPLRVTGGPQAALGIAVPDDEQLVEARELLTRALLASGLVMLAALPLTYLGARLVSRPIRELADETRAIRRFDFGGEVATRSVVSEVDDLAADLASMKRGVRHFLDISAALAREPDFARLLPRLVDETVGVVQARAGVLYLAGDGEGDGAMELASIRRAGATNLPRDLAPPAAAMTALVPAGLASGMGGVCPAADHPCAALANALGLARLAYLAVPLNARDHSATGLLVLWFEAEPTPDLVRFVEALSGVAALSVETRALIRAQRRLFESFIQMLAGAIDAKSPYTGGHCARVPVLTKLLAKAACDATDGPFKDFQLGEDDWEAVHIAAWLHDCGKVATPESIVDKATKLEVRYNRIHEIRMRFEVKKRDARIACLEAVAAGADPAAANATLDRELARLDADFAFVAACNLGGEAMAATDVARLQRIGAQTWTRTLDDRLGLSDEELRRHGAARPLPATETLLADKPCHRLARGPDEGIAPDNRWGFRLAVPALRHNHGELANLSVGRGTLTDEDRYTINEHIVHTVRMLEALPFPRHLRAVPELAGGHHEKIDGTGYPRGLTGDEMSPVARMMAIADIFEALTAADRPYKKGKTLSEAIAIMARMRDEGHIDPNLFALFLRAGVFREYAETHLSPEHLDAVDVEAMLARAG
ncbi:HD domain-containing phosphohydrolase [Zoogloea sp.]|uniref:HD domain-containing phosphohydrolase n=1 Tax=Zoogloea sp. TaxID=49181 RepID=UPI0035B270AE